MNTLERQKLEQRAIKFSILGAAAFAAIGLIYGFYTHSQSILFDGVYSCISLVMSGLTLWVSKLVVRPDDERFQYGYTHLEPLLNVIKAVIISATCLYALTEGVSSLLDGGRVIDLSAAITYACISTFGTLLFGSVIYFYAEKVNSKLAKIDAIDWLFDCLLSSGILAGFVIAYLIRESSMGEYIPYLDPVLVILLTALFLPIPIRIFRDNIREVLVLAPSKALQQQLRECVTKSIKSMGLEVCHLRMAKIGREFNLNVYVMVKDRLDTGNVAGLDEIRQRIADDLKDIDTDSSSMWLEVMFTNDEKWVFE
ncbi:cation transporter [Maricurvus nonylphenolicus]|uniref:cation diffusion facilitator family transporter n=1 Tax=Maricurvus nonylphenolicus TaxID=1008307 RepID=UPI0036F270A8